LCTNCDTGCEQRAFDQYVTTLILFTFTSCSLCKYAGKDCGHHSGPPNERGRQAAVDNQDNQGGVNKIYMQLNAATRNEPPMYATIQQPPAPKTGDESNDDYLQIA
jgi:hypothetical protein